MHGWTVSRKITTSFAVLIVLFLAFGIFANWAGAGLYGATKRLGNWNDMLSMTSQIADAGNAARISGIFAITETDPKEAARYEQLKNQQMQEMDKLFQQYDQLLQKAQFPTEQERQDELAYYQTDLQKWQAYVDSTRNVSNLIAQGRRDQAQNIMEHESRDAFGAFVKAINADEQDSMKRADVEVDLGASGYASIIRSALIALVVMLGVSIFCALKLRRDINGSVERILAILQKVASGDFRETIATTKGDEFGFMAQAVNKMIENMRHTNQRIKDAAISVTDSSATLTRTSEQAAQATQSVAQSITDVASAAANQMDAITETTNQIERINEGIDQATHLTEDVVREINDTTQQATNGNTLAQATVEQMNELADTVDATSKVVSQLGERSKEIGNIVQMISDISAQTNLLSLNAAIEAARAGEHGRGFAVVAEEVRKLAEGSQHATEQIASLITAIQDETSKAVTAMEDGRGKAQKGRENVTASGEGFKHILSMIQRVRESANSIQSTMTGLNDLSSKVGAATERIHQAASRAAQSSENVSAATEEQAAGMEEIAASSRGLADLAVGLKDVAAKIKT